MGWKLFSSTFVLIFIAEMGDKTQLAAFAQASTSGSKWTVFVAASLALIATTAIAVVAGGFIGKHVPTVWVRRGAGVLFIAMGLLFLFTSSQPESPPSESETPASEQSSGQR